MNVYGWMSVYSCVGVGGWEDVYGWMSVPVYRYVCSLVWSGV